jgi:predicted NBD/HSP70 family sugar kinase
MPKPLRVLVIDIGGSNVKLLLSGCKEVRKFRSGAGLTPSQLVRGTRQTARDWRYDAISIGYPGVIKNNRIVEEPQNLGNGWVEFDLRKAMGKPVRIINDAAMQALAHACNGRVLFIGLGTGVGSALVEKKTVIPLELNHLRFTRSRPLELVLSKRGMHELGVKAWTDAVAEMAKVLRKAFLPDVFVLGGGASKNLLRLPKGAVRGWNSDAFVGGLRLWGQAPPDGIIPMSETEKLWRTKLGKSK